MAEEKVRLGRRSAKFPSGYNGWKYVPMWFVWPIVKRSARARAFFIDLPPSRLRMAFVARYYWVLLDHIQKVSFGGFVPAVHPEAVLNTFSMGNYTGPQAWAEVLLELFEAFSGMKLELREFIDLDGTRFLAVGDFGVRGRESGVDMDAEFVLDIQTAGGMAIAGRVYSSREEAFKAVGLSDRKAERTPSG